MLGVPDISIDNRGDCGEMLLTTSLIGQVWCWLKELMSAVKNNPLLRISKPTKVFGFELSGLTQWAETERETNDVIGQLRVRTCKFLGARVK